MEVGQDDDLHRHDEAGEVLAALQPPRSLRQRDVRGLHRELTPSPHGVAPSRAAGLRVARTRRPRPSRGRRWARRSPGARSFYEAREFLWSHRDDYDAACRGFRWPELTEFNWALDHFDAVAADPERGARRALWIVEADGSEAWWTFAELSERSNRVANWLRAAGVARGDRIILMLGNQVELWETLLAAMKLGAVVIPATTLLTASDLRDRLDRGAARHVVVGGADTGRFDGVEGDYTRIAVRGAPRGLAALRGRRRGRPGVRPGRPDPGVGHAAPLLHVRHHRAAEAGGAHARVVPRRPPLDHVLDRPGAGRRAPEHLVAGLGEARVEQRVRAVDRRGDGARRATTPGSTRTPCSTRWIGAASTPSARRPRCGGCSSRPTCPA